MDRARPQVRWRRRFRDVRGGCDGVGGGGEATMKECSTPPSEAVLWEVWWWIRQRGFGSAQACANRKAQTAYQAWRSCNGANEFGACVVRIKKQQPHHRVR